MVVNGFKKMSECDKEIIKKGLSLLEDKNYEEALKVFAEAKNVYGEQNSEEGISIALSFLGMAKYLLDKSNYNECLKFLADADYMAQYSKSGTAKLVNEFAQGTVYFGEGANDLALLHYNNAKNISMESGDELSLMGYVLTRIKQIKSGLDFSTPVASDPLVSLVKIGRSISAVTDIDVLLKVIAEETRIAIQADRCTVFLLDKEKDELWSKVALGMDSQEIRFPADKGLAGYVVKTGEPLNIPDAYNDPRFNPDVDKETE